MIIFFFFFGYKMEEPLNMRVARVKRLVSTMWMEFRGIDYDYGVVSIFYWHLVQIFLKLLTYQLI